MKKHLTLEQRLWNAWSCAEVERLHGIHQLAMAENLSTEDYCAIWDHSDESAWGFMWGWLVGYQEMSYAHNSALFSSHIDHDRLSFVARPELAAVRIPAQAFSEFNELNSFVVEVADDGQSARSCSICTGMCMIPYLPGDGTRWGNFTIERYATDYIFDQEDQRWKYLHEQVSCDAYPDDDFDVGNIGYDAYKRMSETGEPYNANIYEGNGAPPRSYRKVMFGQEYPSAIRPAQHVMRPPEPYRTFGWPNSYLPPDVKCQHIFYKDKNDCWTFDISNCNDEYYTRTVPAGEYSATLYSQKNSDGE